MKGPLGQESARKAERSASSRLRKNTVEAGFGQKPNLCRSAEMERTPGKRKSKCGVARPMRVKKGAIQPPTQASTCSHVPVSMARRLSSSIGSMTPCGKHGAEPTSAIVFASMSLRIASTSTRRSGRSGARRISMSMASAALSKAGWTVIGTTMFNGVSRPTFAFARCASRADFMARKMLSLPPELNTPCAPSGAENRPSP
jgi:hypothetical protein